MFYLPYSKESRLRFLVFFGNYIIPRVLWMGISLRSERMAFFGVGYIMMRCMHEEERDCALHLPVCRWHGL